LDVRLLYFTVGNLTQKMIICYVKCKYLNEQKEELSLKSGNTWSGIQHTSYDYF